MWHQHGNYCEDSSEAQRLGERKSVGLGLAERSASVKGSGSGSLMRPGMGAAAVTEAGSTTICAAPTVLKNLSRIIQHRPVQRSEVHGHSTRKSPLYWVGCNVSTAYMLCGLTCKQYSQRLQQWDNEVQGALLCIF